MMAKKHHGCQTGMCNRSMIRQAIDETEKAVKKWNPEGYEIGNCNSSDCLNAPVFCDIHSDHKSLWDKGFKRGEKRATVRVLKEIEKARVKRGTDAFNSYMTVTEWNSLLEHLKRSLSKEDG